MNMKNKVLVFASVLAVSSGCATAEPSAVAPEWYRIIALLCSKYFRLCIISVRCLGKLSGPLPNRVAKRNGKPAVRIRLSPALGRLAEEMENVL